MHRPRYLRVVRLACTLVSLIFGIEGCGGGSLTQNPSTTSPATVAPSIVTQPSSLTIPIGLEGVFSATVSGNGTLAYQWYRNGIAIPGSDALTYTTPTVSATDTGTVYTFTVSNSLGSATSLPATLTAGARAPKAGDLRFQQVDSENTINGIAGGAGLPEDIVDRGGMLSSPAIGVLDFTYEECPPGGASALGCVYFVTAFAQPPGAVPLATGFCAGFYTGLQSDLTTGCFQGTSLGDGSQIQPNTVITSLALTPEDDRYAFSYTQTSQAGGFDLAQHTVAPSQFQAATTQEGLASRVITAVSYDTGGEITYYSYGWTGDTTAIYETQTATATISTVGTTASSLAAQGYIITALGGDPTADSILLVGTRVQGDTMPRSILVLSYGADETGLLAGGYSVVARVLNNLSNPSAIIGER